MKSVSKWAFYPSFACHCDLEDHVSFKKPKVKPINYNNITLTKTSHDLPSITMAFTFIKLASTTSSLQSHYIRFSGFSGLASITSSLH